MVLVVRAWDLRSDHHDQVLSCFMLYEWMHRIMKIVVLMLSHELLWVDENVSKY